MFRPDSNAWNTVLHGTPSFSVQFASATRMSYSDDFHPRSQSADTRRMRFAQRRMFSEDYVNDTFYAPQGAPLSHSSPENVVYSGSIADPGGVTRRRFAEVNQDGTTLPRSVKTVHFPSTYREQVSEQHTPTQFNSAAHNFTQHLRERSPSSSSALLNLLSRYPSAKQSVYSSTSSSAGVSSPNNESARRIYRLEERPIGTQSFRPTDALLSYSLVEHSVPKFQQQQQQPHYSDSSPHRTQLSLQKESPSQLSSESPLSFPLYNSNFRQSPTLPHSNISDINRNDTQQNVNGFSTLHSTANNSATKAFDNRSEHKFYTDLPNNSHHTLTARNKQWEELLDVTQLDSLLASVLEENMNRSTTEWSNSFAQVQNRFKNMPPETSDSGLLHGFTSSGAPTLPRCSGSFTLPKSSSHNDINQSDSSVRVTGRRTVEAPEVRKSGAIDSFWSQTVNSRPLSSTVQRIPGNLTAAERLQMLQESHSKSNIVNKPGSGIQLAARREHYLHEASSTSSYIPPHRETTKRTGAPHVAYRGPSPNFSDLDNAVNELQCGVRNTGYSSSAGRLGGCARFPTDDRALSPPRGNTAMISRRVNSPSPTDSNSETSSVYQIPTGLPHPKPKHNIKEQLSNAGVPTFTFSRTGSRVSPNFPVPTTGSVASRITEFEKRPGTPILQIAGAPRQEKSPVANGPMSPKSTVYKSKPVIHIETGSRSPRSINNGSTAFEFPPNSFSPQKLDHYETSATKSPIQAGSLHTPEQPEKLSPKANGHLKLSSLSPNDSRKQRDTDSSTTSDSSLNASHGTKNLEESVSILNDKGADVFAPVPPSNQQRKEQVITYPRFYFPQGVPVSMMENDAVLRRVCLFFRELPNEQCSLSDMARVCELTNLPMYWKHPIFMSLTKGESRCASLMDFTVWWRAMTSVAHDEAARFIYTLSYGSRSYLTREDLYGMIMDIMHTHPGLEFCREAVDFHDKYCDVVIARIMWNLGCVWRGKITSDSLRKSDLLEKIRQLQENVDINNCVRYFSYEHFYVIYCKFWEIDTNHDQIVSKADMRMHKDGAITDLVLNRIFSNAVRTSRKDTMNLIDFTNFLLAEEDKTHPTSLEYWFRVLDEDGDGVISMYEMERFHQAVVAKLKEEGIDSISFKDVVCQMLDMICPVNITSFQLSDLKKSPLSVRLLNALVNWRKFYAQEVTEGSERVLDETGRELSDWERFCSEEYETMMENEEEFDENFCVYLDDDEPHNATV